MINPTHFLPSVKLHWWWLVMTIFWIFSQTSFWTVQFLSQLRKIWNAEKTSLVVVESLWTHILESKVCTLRDHACPLWTPFELKIWILCPLRLLTHGVDIMPRDGTIWTFHVTIIGTRENNDLQWYRDTHNIPNIRTVSQIIVWLQSGGSKE